MNKELAQDIASKLHSFGYEVYLSKDGRHGFYTDGVKVVSFGSSWEFFCDFSGNYKPSKVSGTGWIIASEQADITPEQAETYITANAPSWTNNKAPIYTTPEQHLNTYGKSSGYEKFTNAK